jgi:Bacterial mobilisation protein (MobC)
MRPDMLRVDGVTPETKQQLKEAAAQLYGQPNASLLVRQLIASHLTKDKLPGISLTPEQANDTVRIELRLPRVAVEKITSLAEGKFSARNYYLSSVILSHLGQAQMQGDEVDVLRRSNYELSKIGTNLNQIAKAFNILVKANELKAIPEMGKRLASFKREISTHINKVLRVLNAETTVLENSGRGGASKEKKAKMKQDMKRRHKNHK